MWPPVLEGVRQARGSGAGLRCSRRPVPVPCSYADEAPTLVRTTATRVKERSESMLTARSDGASATPPCAPLFPSAVLRLS